MGTAGEQVQTLDFRRRSEPPSATSSNGDKNNPPKGSSSSVSNGVLASKINLPDAFASAAPHTLNKFVNNTRQDANFASSLPLHAPPSRRKRKFALFAIQTFQTLLRCRANTRTFAQIVSSKSSTWPSRIATTLSSASSAARRSSEFAARAVSC